MPDKSIDIKDKVIGSVKWVYLTHILQNALRPFTLVILARFLVPEDYGIVGMAMVIITFTDLFREAGLTQAVIQVQDEIETSANVAFWINLILGAFIVIIIILFSPLASKMFNEPRLKPVLIIQSISIIFASASSVHNALLQRTFEFKKLLGITTIPSLIPLIVAVPFAVAGMGYWALVLSYVVGSIVRCSLLWVYCDWRPTFTFNYVVAKQLFRFGKWIVFNQIIGWIMIRGDTFFVGAYLGTVDLGKYLFSRHIVDLATGFLIQPVFGVIYPAFCRLHQYGEKLKAAFKESFQLISVIVLPAAIGLSLISKPIVPIILGRNWEGIEHIITLMSLLSLSWISCLNPEAYKAIGKPDIMFKFDLMFALIAIGVYWVSVHYGLMGFVIGKTTGIYTVAVHAWLAKRILNLNADYFWRGIRSSLAATIVMGGLVYALVILLGPYSEFSLREASKLFVIVICGISTYIISLRFFDPKLFHRVFLLARSILNG